MLIFLTNCYIITLTNFYLLWKIFFFSWTFLSLNFTILFWNWLIASDTFENCHLLRGQVRYILNSRAIKLIWFELNLQRLCGASTAFYYYFLISLIPLWITELMPLKSWKYNNWQILLCILSKGFDFLIWLEQNLQKICTTRKSLFLLWNNLMPWYISELWPLKRVGHDWHILICLLKGSSLF